MSRCLDDLEPELRTVIFQFLARCVEAGIPLCIVDTLRTDDEHVANLKKGTSRIARSKHLSDELGYAHAIDVAPYEVYQLHGADKLQWNPDAPAWLKIGIIGAGLGVKWGGRWTMKDMGHFEAG